MESLFKDRDLKSNYRKGNTKPIYRFPSTLPDPSPILGDVHPSRRSSNLNGADLSRARPRSLSESSPGRFVPRRNSMNYEVSNFLLKLQRECKETEEDDDVFQGINVYDTKLTAQDIKKEIPRKVLNTEYIRRMACLSEGGTEERSLFKSRNRSENVYQVENTFKQQHRPLPKQPVKTIDIPKLEDNYFTHTVAWSKTNMFAIALDKVLFLYNNDSDVVNTLKTNKTRCFASVAFSPTGEHLVSGSYGRIQLWDVNSSKLISRIPHKHDKIVPPCDDDTICRLNVVAWNHCSPNLFNTGCRSGQLDYFDQRCLGNGPVITITPTKRYTSVCNLVFSNSGQYMASGGIEFTIKIYDFKNPIKPIFNKKAHLSAVRALAWHPFKNNVICSGGGIDDQFIRVWNIQTGEKLGEKDIKAQLCSLQWSPLTNEIITTQTERETGKHSVAFWTYPNLQLVGILTGFKGRILHTAFSQCKRFLSTASADESLQIWKIAKAGGSSVTKTPTLASRYHIR